MALITINKLKMYDDCFIYIYNFPFSNVILSLDAFTSINQLSAISLLPYYTLSSLLPSFSIIIARLQQQRHTVSLSLCLSQQLFSSQFKPIQLWQTLTRQTASSQVGSSSWALLLLSFSPTSPPLLLPPPPTPPLSLQALISISYFKTLTVVVIIPLITLNPHLIPLLLLLPSEKPSPFSPSAL